MQESAQAALSYIRANTNLFGLPDKFYDDKEIHIHVPEGAIPKDGPSAGIAIVTALLSAMTNRPVKKDLAMTGEITLRGRVLAIGGFKEKILAAHRAGIKTVIFPEDNKVNLEEIPKKVQELLELIPVNNIDEVIKLSLVKEENLKRKELKKSIIFRKGKK
jgi:ATP-dependent Lon protease